MLPRCHDAGRSSVGSSSGDVRGVDGWVMVMSGGAEWEYAAEFARLAGQLQKEPSEGPTMDRVVGLAVDTIEACEWCAITVLEPDGRLASPAASDRVAEQAAELQLQLGEGPCLETAWNLGVLMADAEEMDARWPRWAPAAGGLGIQSILCVRLALSQGSLVASLNLFARRPSGFDATDLAIASIFARHAAAALAAARAQDGLRAAARSRQIIGVAEGLLMQRYGLTLDQAFELLLRYSQSNNVALRVLAEQLVQSGGIPASTPNESDAGLDHTLHSDHDD